MQNVKYSRQREVLLDVLKNTKCHPNADWIYEKVRKEIPNISLGTVYRNLALLHSAGMIQKIDVGGGSDRFDADISPHAHFICTSCGDVIDIYTDYLECLKPDIERKNNFSVCDCSVIFRGICSECAKDDNKSH